MNPTIGIAIMMNNYFHDVATAMLAASGAAIYLILKRYGDGGDRAKAAYFMDIYKGMTKVARFSLYWILIGGVPRTLAYRSFEWSNAVSHEQIPALIVKQFLAFAIVAAGVVFWLNVTRKVKALGEGLGA